MIAKEEGKPLLAVVGGFLLCYWLPVGAVRFDHAILEALQLVRWYAREHVLLCLVPAFLIAGGIAAFLRRESVTRYLGARANKVVAYGVASVSGTILAVCSCTVLPLFAGIYRRGAGIGPATAFLYAGPSINVLAIILTARVLGPELGVARAVGAIGFSVVIGLVMSLLFPDAPDDAARTDAAAPPPGPHRSLVRDAGVVAAMVGILVFANWAAPSAPSGAWNWVHAARWPLTALLALALAVMLVAWFGASWRKLALGAAFTALLVPLFPGTPTVPFAGGVLALVAAAGSGTGELREWIAASWDLAKQILPLLLVGVLVAGALLGRPGQEGLIPAEWVHRAVGGNSPAANLFAAVSGAFMYFATLTEVPILQGLVGSGMGKGPALALLLAGPALSLPNMLVIRSVIGGRKTAVYVALVVVMASLTGILFGALSP